ncbi:MAG: hypothetical protein AAF587_33820 [Bacteroidota bacterium]
MKRLILMSIMILSFSVSNQSCEVAAGAGVVGLFGVKKQIKKTRQMVEEQSEDWQVLIDEHATAYYDLAARESAEWRDFLDGKSDNFLSEAELFRMEIEKFNDNVSTLTGEIHTLREDLPNHLKQAADDLERVLQTSLTVATASALCATDVFEQKLQANLQILESRLVGDSYETSIDELTLLEPLICSSSLTVIDLTFPTDRRKFVLLAGSNIPAREMIDLTLETSTGTPVYTSNTILSHSGNNGLVVDLTGFEDSYLAQFSRFSLTFQGVVLIEIPIIK